jgi:uncharacterized hydrophobic protein (TIGR00271 family)
VRVLHVRLLGTAKDYLRGGANWVSAAGMFDRRKDEPAGVRMLQLRVYGDSPSMAVVADRLDALSGARHVSLLETAADGAALVTADLRAEAADRALATLETLGVSADDIALVRLDTIAPGAGAGDVTALIWADVLGQARLQARAPARYLVLMAAAGVIAGLAVVNNSPTLIVGAMAISPDLLPVTAACTGLVFRRRRLVVRGLAALIVGLGTAGALAAVVSVLLDRSGLMPAGFDLGEFSVAQTHVNATTILVALAAGVAGMLTVETRASSAVGVAISVTTIPAAAYLGVALGIGEFGKSLSAFAVLGANIAMMLIGGSIALAVQRTMASTPAWEPPRAKTG